jgi:hypothetical protein
LLSRGYPCARDIHSRSASRRNLRGRATIVATRLARSTLPQLLRSRTACLFERPSSQSNVSFANILRDRTCLFTSIVVSKWIICSHRPKWTDRSRAPSRSSNLLIHEHRCDWTAIIVAIETERSREHRRTRTACVFERPSSQSNLLVVPTRRSSRLDRAPGFYVAERRAPRS